MALIFAAKWYITIALLIVLGFMLKAGLPAMNAETGWKPPGIHEADFPAASGGSWWRVLCWGGPAIRL
jgi:hypothetical protein